MPPRLIAKTWDYLRSTQRAVKKAVKRAQIFILNIKIPIDLFEIMENDMDRYFLLIFYFTFYFIIGLCNSYAQAIPRPHFSKKKPTNCHIQITSAYKTGKVKIKTSHFNYPSKAECQKMNTILSDNFSPSEIENIKTKMEWTGK